VTIHRVCLVFLVVLAAVVPCDDTRADDGGVTARRQHVVAHVGSTAVTVGDLEDRLADLPTFQRASFGGTPDLIRRRFLAEVVVPDALLALGADERRLDQHAPAAYIIERARSAATIRAIRSRIGTAAAIPADDVQRYYDERRSRYDAPERYQIWRILCKTRDEAQSVLDAAKLDPTPATFGTLAREHSLDKATNLRAGNLGFVAADGSSNEPGLRVDPALVRAVQSVHDGALVPAPIPEGDYSSVAWRRGTIAPTKRTVGEVAAQIRDALWKTRVKEETDRLVSRLRAEKVRALDVSPLEGIDLPVDGAVPPHKRAAADAVGSAR
jgi:peptidyl-prolyl cis-trans isomerase C